MGRKKEYTKKRLEEGINAYFDSISALEPLFELEPIFKKDRTGDYVPALDKYGHQRLRRVPVIAANGKQAVRTKWIIQPKITDLCVFLGITTTTWSNYCKQEEFVESTTRAQGRVESYWQELLETKHGSRGAKFVLEYNCGWRGKKEKVQEDDNAAGSNCFAEHLTMEQKLAEIRNIAEEAATLLPKEETDEGKQTD